MSAGSAPGALLLRIDVDAEADARGARAPPRHVAHGLADGVHGAAALGGLDHEHLALAAAQAKQRRRAEHASRRAAPLRAGAAGGARRSARARAAAAARAASARSAEQTTLIRCENGG